MAGGVENMESDHSQADRNSDASSNSSFGHDMRDITIIEDGDERINYNGMDDELMEDFNVAATLTLKKNLHDAFEKHAEDVKNSGVKAKIQAFERVNLEQKMGESSRNLQKTNKVRFETNAERPPVVPVTKKVVKPGSESLLTVYLRVRPSSASKEAMEESDDACHNTIEIVPSQNVDTKIRTYPPVESNTSKSNRDKGHHFSRSSSSTDDKALECAVKGVKEFEFSQVFGPDSSQEDLYKSTAVPLVEGLFPKSEKAIVGDRVLGHSALLFSYGMTNAGKTYTMMGKNRSSKSKDKSEELQETHGIIPRAVAHILDKIERFNSTPNESGVKYCLTMSYLEIYNEDIYDLLPKKSSASSKFGKPISTFDTENKLQLRDLRNGNIQVRGLSKHRVSSLHQGLELANDAMKKRHTSSNNINMDSSRSHSICQFEVHAVPRTSIANDENMSITTEVSGYATDDDSVSSNTSKPKSVRFWVVDLAGSERSKRTGAFSRSTRQKEASIINNSLMNLMTCLRAMKNNQATNNGRSMVPFRDSKLTHMFMGHLTGASASRTSMIVNVNPSIADFDETQRVLLYAVDARSVRIDHNEYNKKTMEIQSADVIAKSKAAHTHDESGRPLKSRSKSKTKSPPKKIAKLAKKLSPRAALARRREVQAVRKKATASGETRKITKVAGSKRKLEMEVSSLQDELEKSRRKAAKYEEDASAFQQQLEKCETDIREELAEETAAQIEFMRQQHDDIVKKLKQRIQNASQTPSKSAKKADIDKANMFIDQLLDKVEEGEEESRRMKEEYEEALENLCKEKDAEIAELSERHAKELAKKDEEIAELRAQLEADTSLTGESELESELSYEESDKENILNQSMESSGTPGLKRLRTGRASEVACTTLSPPKEHPPSSSRSKRSLRRRPQNSPFKSLKRSSATVEEIIYPSSRELDEDGLYKKPRGRAPQGRTWDKNEGGWKLSILA